MDGMFQALHESLKILSSTGPVSEKEQCGGLAWPFLCVGGCDSPATIFSIVVYLITELPPAIVAASTSHARHANPSPLPPTCLHRIQRKPGRASRMNSHDEALDSEARAAADHPRVSLEESED
jgi:hypothetical protein